MLRLQRDPGGRRESGAGMRRESGSPSKFALDQLAQVVGLVAGGPYPYPYHYHYP